MWFMTRLILINSNWKPPKAHSILTLQFPETTETKLIIIHLWSLQSTCSTCTCMSDFIYLYLPLFIFIHLLSPLFIFIHPYFFSLPELLQLQMMNVVIQFIQKLFAKSIQIWSLIKCYVQELQVVVLILAKGILEVNYYYRLSHNETTESR